MANLELAKDPWLKNTDISFYDFSSHCIYLNCDKETLLGNNWENVFTRSKPFVVLADTIRTYIGAFHSLVLSSLSVGPYIDELDLERYPNDVLHISKARNSNNDVRNHDQIHKLLLDENICSNGLEVELVSFNIINKANISTVEYKIKIINNDKDNLLILSPNKMGSNLFHYFTNGPYLWNDQNKKYISAENKEVESPEPWDSWKVEWMDVIKSGNSIEYTIELKGYPQILSGTYKCSFTFSNPKNISKNRRTVENNRIWIGEIESKAKEIYID